MLRHSNYRLVYLLLFALKYKNDVVHKKSNGNYHVAMIYYRYHHEINLKKIHIITSEF